MAQPLWIGEFAPATPNAPDFVRIAPDVRLGPNVRLHAFVNLYGCKIGAGTQLGTFVEIQKGCQVGRRCKISSHSLLCEGVDLADEVFIGHGVMFTNTRVPRSTTTSGGLQRDGCLETSSVPR
jgi:UDP-3-O-[3-hydroxymyristoyl] glucosamine N-acyltransferase